MRRREDAPARDVDDTGVSSLPQATQIAEECAKLCFDAPSSKKNWCVCCYGGANARFQLSCLAKGVEVLVATPGRLVDFLDRATDRGPLVSLDDVRFAVLDEADRMLDMGFEPQLKRIVASFAARDIPL